MSGQAAEQHVTLPRAGTTCLQGPGISLKGSTAIPRTLSLTPQAAAPIAALDGDLKKNKEMCLSDHAVGAVIPTHVSFFLVWS